MIPYGRWCSVALRWVFVIVCAVSGRRSSQFGHKSAVFSQQWSRVSSAQRARYWWWHTDPAELSGAAHSPDVCQTRSSVPSDIWNPGETRGQAGQYVVWPTYWATSAWYDLVIGGSHDGGYCSSNSHSGGDSSSSSSSSSSSRTSWSKCHLTQYYYWATSACCNVVVSVVLAVIIVVVLLVVCSSRSSYSAWHYWLVVV